VFFYHSSSEHIGIVGLCEVLLANVADPTQFDPKSKYFDPKSSKAEPRWQTVKVGFGRKFSRVVTLDELKAAFTGEEFALVRKGMRLSVMPVAADVAQRILTMAG
jgi:predicted RNA-binding protein with PUA-like domain